MTTNPTRQEPSAYGISGAAGRLYWAPDDVEAGTGGAAIEAAFGVIAIATSTHPDDVDTPAWLLTIQPACDVDQTWLPFLQTEDAAGSGSSASANVKPNCMHVVGSPTQILVYLSDSTTGLPLTPAGLVDRETNLPTAYIDFHLEQPFTVAMVAPLIT